MSGMQAARAPGSCSTTSRVSMPAAAVPWRRTTEAAANRPLVPTTGKSTASSARLRTHYNVLQHCVCCTDMILQPLLARVLKQVVQALASTHERPLCPPASEPSAPSACCLQLKHAVQPLSGA